eukprot:XP_011413072.2 PREDICTED: retinol-binding protein 4-A-like [Crassostrea gigas]
MVTFGCLIQNLVASNCTLRVDSIQVETNFTLDMYLGRWYEIKWFSDMYFPPDQLYHDYSQVLSRRQGGNITATSHIRDPVNTQGCALFYSTIILTDIPGKMLMNRLNQGKLADYWVVKTDYSNYAVVYECKEQNPDNTCKTTMSWVLSRHRKLSDTLMAEVGHVIDSLCLNEAQFYTTTQTLDCSTSTDWRNVQD